MKKEMYIRPDIEVIELGSDNVIVTSTPRSAIDPDSESGEAEVFVVRHHT